MYIKYVKIAFPHQSSLVLVSQRSVHRISTMGHW